MPHPDDLANLETEISVLVRKIRRAMADKAHELHPDLTALGYSMMVLIQMTGAQRASQIVDSFAVDKGAVSRQVQTLVDFGLVHRMPDPNDGRAALLDLTAEGRRRLAEVTDRRREMVPDRLQDWSREDLGDFVAMLARYNKSLG